MPNRPQLETPADRLKAGSVSGVNCECEARRQQFQQSVAPGRSPSHCVRSFRF